MRLIHHDIHRATARQLAANQYNDFVAGALYAPVFAGLFGAFLLDWPFIFLAYVCVVIHATRRQIRAARDSDFGRFVSGWLQHVVLFITSFAGVAALMDGSREYATFLVFALPPILIEYLNRRKCYRALHFHVARAYIRDVYDVRTRLQRQRKRKASYRAPK
ncbi:hypothetical protein [Noviherbaspirillum denitrificans]|uniref:Uncharacterized protein n=1 Tax=Noviherbaspirillum denitrificans TaxID=1968433 RepID=A0A254T9Q7_9BURK|nr:hypothetical protein [Noviherbaspirillum denitrificans]OWW18907.1 hypothetical protein AYR66_04820 [Noviherbaspirillum denitrificans]